MEKQMFKNCLPNINLLYLGGSVLILLDRLYMSRFWTQFEAVSGPASDSTTRTARLSSKP